MSIKLVRAKGDLAKATGPLAVLTCADTDLSKRIGGELGKALDEPRRARAFEAETLARFPLYWNRRRVLLVGLGKRAELNAATLRRAGAAAAGFAKQCKSTKLAVWADDAGKIGEQELGRALAEGVVLGAYHFHGVKTEKKPPALQSVQVHAAQKTGVGFGRGLTSGSIDARAQCLARDLGNLPANRADPAHFAKTARKIARDTGIRCKVIGLAELRKRKFGGLLAVNQGSALPPVFLELEYGARNAKKTICLIGKGLTFDTGGISLKPSAGMEEMKFDMCGGGAVLGAMAAIGEKKPAGVRVIALVPVTDNMPSGTALRPGDVITSYGGTTIEVINTDAEGRLVLADALGRAQELKPDYTVDLATLTGACVIALGHRATGMFCADDDLRGRLENASADCGEPIWPLPPWDEYGDDMKSAVADIKNSGPRWGGACTAYAFLKKFAGDLRWAHLDIAGTGWDMPKNEFYEQGATGIGVRTLVRLVEKLS